MGIFGGAKNALMGGARSGGGQGPGILTYLLSGSSGVDRARKAQEEQKLRGLLSTMPMPNEYAPPQFQAPNGESDPLADVPYEARQRTWLRDFAAAGGDVPLTSLLPKAQETQTIEGPDGIYERTPKGWVKAMPYPEKERPAPSGMIRNPETGALEFEPGYLEMMLKLAGGRRDVITSNPMPRAPPRARAGGGGMKLPPGFILD